MPNDPYNFGFADESSVEAPQIVVPTRDTIPRVPGGLPGKVTPGLIDPGMPADQSQDSTGKAIIAQLLARIKGDDNPVTSGSAGIGQVAGSLANDERMNRLSRGAMTQNYDQTMLQAQAGRNQNESDALKKLAITSYLKSGGFQGGPSAIQLDGQMRSLPSYGSAPRPASDAQKQSSGTLEDMLTQRLMSGGSYLPQDLESYAQPGKVENISRYGGTIASGLGLVNDMMNQGQGQGQGQSNNVYKALGRGAKKLGGGIISGLRKMF